MGLIKGKVYSTVEPYYEPGEILDRLSEEDSRSEMTPFEQSFLCGLIKEYKPRKIVEVGVAAGTTSVIVLNCIEKLNLQAKFYSVDISEAYYTDRTKQTGYVIEKAKSLLPGKTDHTLLLGKELAERIETIGDGIDLLIIDTMHTLPGELIDFLAAYPYLSGNAIVVLHDVTLNVIGQHPPFIATKLLLDTVSAEKFFPLDGTRPAGMANIAAFRINEETRVNIGDVFSCMTISWQYLPSEESISHYRKIIKKNYDPVHLKQFDMAWEAQKCMRRAIETNRLVQKQLYGLEKGWINEEHVLLYGCGKVGKEYYDYAVTNGLNVDGMLVSDLGSVNEEDKAYFDVPIYEWGKQPFGSDECKVVIAVGRKLYYEILKNVVNDGYVIL